MATEEGFTELIFKLVESAVAFGYAVRFVYFQLSAVAFDILDSLFSDADITAVAGQKQHIVVFRGDFILAFFYCLKKRGCFKGLYEEMAGIGFEYSGCVLHKACHIYDFQLVVLLLKRTEGFYGIAVTEADIGDYYIRCKEIGG